MGLDKLDHRGDQSDHRGDQSDHRGDQSDHRATVSSVLVANRGEIALRVFRTARVLGLRTIAIYTDLDAAAPHVREADEAVRVDSYLDIDAVVAAAQRAGADAVHPGYGFLSERAEFARALEEAGIRLVGPSAAVMEQMGRKDAAREVAERAGVPVVPSYSLETPADQLAFPVLVKAASGGGGKGMRVVRSAAEYADAVAAAAREARSAFGDDTLLIEKYVESGRHIEVQVMGDRHGRAVHFHERDCSTQRRHQKVLEEAPAPTIGAELREAVTAAAVALAEQVGYTGAGTVEFLLDNATGDFYFLEMNTRLQVEHPVTEMVHGDHDLVADQLRMAEGAPLAEGGQVRGWDGHAIEARVYAEDSFNGFLPQAGRAGVVHWPGAHGGRASRVRVDHALESGQVVSTSYDPMLGKVIAWGRDREQARRALVAALDDTAILGLTTNAGFLRALAASDEFRYATIDTAWLDQHEVPAPDPTVARLIGALVVATRLSGSGHPFAADGWRASRLTEGLRVDLDEELRVLVDADSSTIDGRELRILERDALDDGAERLRVEVDGERHVAFVAVSPSQVEVVHRGQRHVFERPDPNASHGEVRGEGSVTAPMPGTVLQVLVAEGDTVEAGQSLGMMEAMKMELTLKAPYSGTVTTVAASVAQQVALGDVLFEVTD
ncbi:acetyl/propionyl/methylcrotonyl-CoA carboxylase subunit alpha [Nocardioides daejeonensis]|uniref:acetyl/propionyl/methylcrotonyl-CoA carboxylase subunit alpha n=1 Tax=Nocardioides daejeonensis TaxID=1046556 RepID=UPI000D74655D|nr:biotin carboxylase N-terminal domain-containing protein [Nocardioides daejeonensis]